MPITAPPVPCGFVRPRYDDGELDEPLLLQEAVLEWAQDPGGRRLVLLGPRGSGLSTTLAWLAELLGGPRFP